MSKRKRMLSSALAILLCCSTLMHSAAAMAAAESSKPEVQTENPSSGGETQMSEAALYKEEASSLPTLSEVQERLSEGEKVTAEDITIEVGMKFDIASDFSELTFSKQKVRVAFKDATDEKLEKFQPDRVGSYQATYEAYPIRDSSLAYQVSRMVIVKDREVETKAQKDRKANPDKDAKGEDSEEDPALQNVQKGESLEKVKDSKESAAKKVAEEKFANGAEGNPKQEVIAAQDTDEGLFLSVVPAETAARSTPVTLVKGDRIPYPSNLGNYETNLFFVNGKLAYCLESPKASPLDADYIAEVLDSNANLQKVLYYGYGGPGDLTDEYMPELDADLRYIFTHLAASYAYMGNEGFHGCPMEALESCGIIAYIDFLFGQEPPPVAAIGLNSDYEKAYLEGEQQRTGAFELVGDHRNYVALNVPENVTYHSDAGEKQTGGTVHVHGGDRFYFTAPKTVTGEWDTGNLKGQIGAQWKTLVLSTGGSTQDIGYGDFIEDEANSIHFTVKWMDIAKITVMKRDQDTNVNLPKSVFGVYSDQACTDLIITMPETDDEGRSSVEFEKTKDTVYIREITAPAGYCLNTSAYNVELVAGGNTDVAVKNKEQKGKIKIHKTGEKLTGAEQGDPMRFIYANSSFSGASYAIYAGEDIMSQDNKTVICKKGTLLETLTTAEDGDAVSKELYLGKYRVVETKAPDDLTIGKGESETTKTVVLEYAGQEASLSKGEAEYHNQRPEVAVKSVKKSQNDDATLQNATYGLYAGDDIKAGTTLLAAKDALLQTVASNVDGVAAFTADIPLNHEYYIREIQAPDQYYKSDETFAFTYAYKDDKAYEYVFSHEFKNEEARAEIHVKKIDAETNAFLSQGDASLAGAEYGLFAAQNIKHPNKKSDDVYQKGELVARGFIGDNGALDFTNLYLGEYYVKELNPADGYLLDATEYPVEATYEGQDVKIVHREATVKETVKKRAFQLIKVGSDGEQTEADILKGAGFKIYLISSLRGAADGGIKPDANGNYSPEQFRTYDFSEDATALDYSEDRKGVPTPELFTDEKGYALSRELAYGKYVVIESTVPENYSPIDPFIVTINEDSREPQQWRVFIDYEFEAYLKIYKIDGTSKRPVLHSGATFKIYDLEKGEYVKQYIHYPELVEHTEFVTSDAGYLVTPEKLKAGHYRLEETQAPEGFVKGEPIEFSIDSNTAYEVEGETGAVIIKMDYENARQTGTLRLHKTGERLTGFEKEPKSLLRRFCEFLKVVGGEGGDAEFSYEACPLAGAEFEIYATQDIYSPDYQRANGERILLYKEGELASTIKTNEKGEAALADMPLGSYKIVETVAGNGHVLNKEVQEFTLEYAGDEVDVVYQDSAYANKRQKVSIQITKLDAENKSPVAGATFGLYAAEDILDATGNIIIPADALIERATSDEQGMVGFTKDLPIAHYYAKEETPAPGYVLNEEAIDFDLQYDDQEAETLEAQAELTNDCTKADISKVDIGGKDVIGAELTIINSKGEEVASWVTDGSPHRIERLEPGEYTLIEKQAPDGYEVAEEVKFTVLETGEIQKVQMVDEYEKKGTVSVQKVGDMLTGTSAYASDFGKINRMEYEKRSLPGVEFTIYDKEGNVADVITSTEEGVATSKELPLGEYTLKETKTPAGLAMNYNEYKAALTKDDENKVIDVSLDIENNVIDTEINVYKVGEALNPENGAFGYGKKPLEGVYFGIYTGEEIKNYREESVLPQDSLIGVIKTNGQGKATLKAALVSGRYYYKELQTLEGYVLDEEKHPFELTLANEPVTVFDVNKENPALNKLMKAKTTLVKVDASNEKKKLSGAEFELFEASGKSLGVYVTDGNGELHVEDLGYGDYYFKENHAPDGYQKLADKIEFSMKGQDVTITCRNHAIPKAAIPKLGFEDSTTMRAIAFVAIGLTVLGAGFLVYRMKKKSRRS